MRTIKNRIVELMGEFADLFDADDIKQFETMLTERGEGAVTEAMAQEIKERSED